MIANRWAQAVFSFMVAAMALTVSAPAAVESRAVSALHVCSAAEAAALANGIDPAFFARLLWRESLFDPHVVSPKGAQGIAQFMPGTAAQRGLADPFDPLAAVAASAAYLAELKKTFGNIGLAAAAYNAGEERVSDWLGGKGHLPAETQAYVSFITGHAAEDWRKPGADFAIPPIGAGGAFIDNCVALATRTQELAESHLPSAPRQPWGAVLAVNFSEGTAVAMFRRLKLRFPEALAQRDPLILRKRNLSRGSRSLSYVMLGAESRLAAETNCRALVAKGAPCIVRKN